MVISLRGVKTGYSVAGATLRFKATFPSDHLGDVLPLQFSTGSQTFANVLVYSQFVACVVHDRLLEICGHCLTRRSLGLLHRQADIESHT